jgi:hypothetical protein
MEKRKLGLDCTARRNKDGLMQVSSVKWRAVLPRGPYDGVNEMAESGEVKVALASLVKMINLLGAELLVGKYRENIDVFESCMRAKLFAHVDGASPQETAAGVALAQSLVDPVLKSLRDRVRNLNAAECPAPADSTSPARVLN